jgi:hypothetical protein
MYLTIWRDIVMVMYPEARLDIIVGLELFEVSE